MCKALSTSSRFGKTTDTRITLPASNSCARLPHSVSAFTDCKHIHRGANPLLLSRIRTQNMFQPIWLGFFLGSKYWPCSTETAYWPRLFFIVEKESVLRCIIFNWYIRYYIQNFSLPGTNCNTFFSHVTFPSELVVKMYLIGAQTGRMMLPAAQRSRYDLQRQQQAAGPLHRQHDSNPAS